MPEYKPNDSSNVTGGSPNRPPQGYRSPNGKVAGEYGSPNGVGQSYSSPNSLISSNYPTISISAPAQNAIVSGQFVQLTADASANTTEVEFYAGNTQVGFTDAGAPWEAFWDTTVGFPDGPYVITARARNADLEETISAPVNVNVNNIATTIAVTAPAQSAAISGPAVLFSASGNDLVGVTFIVDGTDLVPEDTAAPFSTTIDSTQLVNGAHVLTARGRGADGLTAISAPINVTVTNIDTPTVAITSPTEGATIAGSSVTLIATADAAGPVLGVQFKVNDVDTGPEDTVGPPWSVVIDSTLLAEGAHAITAEARTASASTTSAAINVTVDNIPLSAEILAPSADETISGDVTFTANCTDAVGCTFLMDGVAFGTEDVEAPFSIVQNTSIWTNGPHVVTARASDVQGNLALSEPVSIVVDNAALIVAITSPSPGEQVSGASVVITADASADAIGVQFKLNGSNLGSEDVSGPPWSVNWDTTSIADGFHQLGAIVRNAAAQTADANPVTVEVDNIPLVVTITYPLADTTVSGIVSVTATTNNDIEVGFLSLLVDNSARGQDNLAPWSIDWDSTSFTNGAHTLRVAAFSPESSPGAEDWRQIGLSAQVNITTSNVVILPPPVNGAVSITVAASTTVPAPSLPWPSGYALDDIAFLFIEMGINDSYTLPVGWENVIGSPQSNGTTTKAMLAWKRANSVSEPPIELGLAPSDHFVARMHLYRGCKLTGAPYEEMASNQQVGATVVNLPALSIMASNVKIAYASARGVDNDSIAFYGALTNASMSAITERYEMGTLLGNGGGGAWWTATPLAAGDLDPATGAVILATDMINFTLCLVAQANETLIPPTVQITAPLEGATISGPSVAITANALNALGVQFKVNGQDIQTEDTTEPYGITVDSTLISDGPHIITAVARGAGGDLVTSTPINVTVSNSAPTAPTVFGMSVMVQADVTTAAESMAWPAGHQAGDVAFILLEMANTDTWSLPAGFAHVTGSPWGGGTPAMMMALAWKRATSGSEPAVNLGTAPIDHYVARMIVFRGCKAAGNPYLELAMSTINNSSLVEQPAITLTKANSLVVYATTRQSDSSSLSIYPGLAAVAMASITEEFELGTTLGNGGGGRLSTGVPNSTGNIGVASETLGVAPNQINVTLALVTD